jgi:hypothetical protein
MSARLDTPSVSVSPRSSATATWAPTLVVSGTGRGACPATPVGSSMPALDSTRTPALQGPCVQSTPTLPAWRGLRSMRAPWPSRASRYW